MRTPLPPGALCKQEGQMTAVPFTAINNTATNHGLLSLGQVYILSSQFSHSVVSDSL